jgi:hypothetical protein
MPITLILGRFKLRAISGFTTTSAPPPSVMTQQSSRCSGLAMIGERTTSSTVTTSRSSACSLCCACCEAATLIQASCSLVVPYSCMWRCAHIAYTLATVGPYGYSNCMSGTAGLPARGAVPVAWPSLRGRPASVTKATLQRPAAMASAACATCSR